MRLHQDTGSFGAARLGTGELTDLKRLGLCLFLNLENTETTVAYGGGFSTLIPLTGSGPDIQL